MSKERMIINPSQMCDLTDCDLEMIQELVQSFIEDTPVRLQKLRTALLTGEQYACQYEAHSIKGAAGSMGFELVADAAFEIEERARLDKVDDAKLFWPALEETYSQFLKTAAEYSWEDAIKEFKD